MDYQRPFTSLRKQIVYEKLLIEKIVNIQENKK